MYLSIEEAIEDRHKKTLERKEGAVRDLQRIHLAEDGVGIGWLGANWPRPQGSEMGGASEVMASALRYRYIRVHSE